MKKAPLHVWLAKRTGAPSLVMLTEEGQLIGGANAGELGSRQLRRMAARELQKRDAKARGGRKP